MVEYIPKQGDIVTLSFDPQSGHEQKGRRPALIVSNKTFNSHLSFAYACPITSTKRNSPFHVQIQTNKVQGFIMTEQLKSVDYRSRKIKFVEQSPKDVLEQVLGIVESIIN
ncbi:MAG: type II toxin-antitoxin system PemK/MazF family toxin [Campylobacteraceae bacterium]|nr:type II toxin-antitoxin system PemK/MazF family toxin [Campylobacteraceae bacterium]